MNSTAAMTHQHNSPRTVDRLILHLGLALVSWSRRSRRNAANVDHQLLLLETESVLAARQAENVKHLYEYELTR